MYARAYSTLFSCLYDEPTPVGHLGRGTHYSVFRSVEWLNVNRESLALPEVHDFAVIWDEDHDVRVIEVVEQIFMAGLLSPVQFIGERKGIVSVILAACFRFAGPEGAFEDYVHRLEKITENPGAKADIWQCRVGLFDRSPHSPPTDPHQTETAGIITAENHRVVTYLRNIDSLWALGTKPYPQPVPKNFSPWDNVPAPPVPRWAG